MGTTQNRRLTVGLVQQRCVADKEASIRRSIEGIREARDRGARLVALQELHTWTYFCQAELDANFDLAEPIPGGPSYARLAQAAAQVGVVLVVSLFERRAPGLFHNTAAVIEADGRLAGIYRKTHIPNDPQFFEKFYFAPGDLGIRPIETSVGRAGVLVCWDQWYPEAARVMALAGADFLVYPTAIGWKPDDSPDEQARQPEAWMTVQRSHAAANALPVIVPNRVGFEPDPTGIAAGGRSATQSEHKPASTGKFSQPPTHNPQLPADSFPSQHCSLPTAHCPPLHSQLTTHNSQPTTHNSQPTTPAPGGLTFWGNSFIAGPRGELLARASSNSEEVLVAEIDFSETEAIRREMGFFRDRRPDLYRGLLRRSFLDNCAPFGE